MKIEDLLGGVFKLDSLNEWRFKVIILLFLDGNEKDSKKLAEEEVECRECDYPSANSGSNDEVKRYTAAGTVAAPPV